MEGKECCVAGGERGAEEKREEEETSGVRDDAKAREALGRWRKSADEWDEGLRGRRGRVSAESIGF